MVLKRYLDTDAIRRVFPSLLSRLVELLQLEVWRELHSPLVPEIQGCKIIDRNINELSGSSMLQF
jgi:hypothetical protein